MLHSDACLALTTCHLPPDHLPPATGKQARSTQRPTKLTAPNTPETHQQHKHQHTHRPLQLALPAARLAHPHNKQAVPSTRFTTPTPHPRPQAALPLPQRLHRCHACMHARPNAIMHEPPATCLHYFLPPTSPSITTGPPPHYSTQHKPYTQPTSHPYIITDPLSACCCQHPCRAHICCRAPPHPPPSEAYYAQVGLAPAALLSG